MSLKSLFLPWLVIRELREDLEDAGTIGRHWKEQFDHIRVDRRYFIEETVRLGNVVSDLRSQIARFDADGDGYIGGSKPRH